MSTGVSFFYPFRKGVTDLVTYADLFMFCTMVISLISLIIQIKKK